MISENDLLALHHALERASQQSTSLGVIDALDSLADEAHRVRNKIRAAWRCESLPQPEDMRLHPEYTDYQGFHEGQK